MFDHLDGFFWVIDLHLGVLGNLLAAKHSFPEETSHTVIFCFSDGAPDVAFGRSAFVRLSRVSRRDTGTNDENQEVKALRESKTFDSDDKSVATPAYQVPSSTSTKKK